MSQSVRAALVFAGLLVAVITVSYLYSRSVRGVPDSAPVAGAGLPDPAGPTGDGPALSPEVVAGIEALRSEEYEQARKHLESVTAQDPSYLVALQNLGAVYAALGDLEASLAALSELAELQPDDPRIYGALAWAQHRLDRDADAELTMLRSLELDPRNLLARYHLAYFRLAQGSVAAAIRAYQRAIQLDTSQIHVLQAAHDVEQLQLRRPEQAEIHYALAYFARVLGQPEVEREELELYLSMAPDGPAAEVARKRLAEVEPASS